MEQPSIIITNMPATKPDYVTPKTINVGKIMHHGRKKNLSHSSSTGSSPDSPLVADSFNINEDDDKSISSTDSSHSPHKRDHDSLTELPNSQEMEQSAYRIPSSVFASSTQADWSVASNESLFSINGSFKSEHPFWRSGELGLPGDQASTSDHMFSYSAQHPRRAEIVMSRELGLLVEETMKEVIRENETTNQTTNVATPVAVALRSSSTKSFAFSIKEGDGESWRTHSSVRSVSEEQGPAQYQMELRVSAQPQPPVANRDHKKDPAPRTNTVCPRKWFPVFSCCSMWCSRS